MKRPQILIPAVLAVVFAAASAPMGADSICYGTTSKGELEDGCKLPYSGDNFRAYSRLGSTLGRTYVHCKIAGVVLAAYEDLKQQHPEKVFVYGETGWTSGGSFKPHKTHQNGLSVDFMVPVLDKSGESVPRPTSALNKHGYDVDFDANGSNGELTIDFEAMAAHILAIKRAANAEQVGIWRVIFDPKLRPFLHETKAWPALEGQVEFSERRSWVRHDDHYHIDFDVPCKPLTWRRTTRASTWTAYTLRVSEYGDDHVEAVELLRPERLAGWVTHLGRSRASEVGAVGLSRIPLAPTNSRPIPPAEEGWS